MYETIYNLLEKSTVTKTCRRTNVAKEPVRSMTFGITGLRTRSWESAKNKKFPELYKALKNFAVFLDPDFKYTSITLNKNLKCLPHKDKNNIGDSMIVTLGDFTGGRLIINGEKYDIHNKHMFFNGSENIHETEEFEGTRYSIIYFNRK